MAKMFYKLAETAEKLGVSEDDVKQMANAGRLQQFRDGNELMFKREQVDGLAASDDSGAQTPPDAGASQTGEIELAGMGETGEMAAPSDASQTGEIELAGETGEVSISDTEETTEGRGAGDTLATDAINPKDSPEDSGEYGLADSGGGDVVSIESGDSGELDGSGMGGSVLGGSGLRGSELGGGDELGGIGSGVGSSGLLSGLGSGLGSGVGSSGLLGDKDESDEGDQGGKAKEGSGVSVFDADEVDNSDPMAQTMMADAQQGGGRSGEDELALDSVGSGSGLLDLTREADDTSLGAELLDEIYPGAETTADTKMDSGADASSGVFDGSVTLEAKDASGVELPEAVEAGAEEEPEQAPAALEEAGEPAARPVYYATEAYDPAGSGMSTGMLLIATAILVVGTIVSIFAIGGIPSAITTQLAGEQQTLYIAAGAGVAAAVVFGLVGMLVGKAMGR